jgi:hypothetical protein
VSRFSAVRVLVSIVALAVTLIGLIGLPGNVRDWAAALGITNQDVLRWAFFIAGGVTLVGLWVPRRAKQLPARIGIRSSGGSVKLEDSAIRNQDVSIDSSNTKVRLKRSEIE